MDDPELERQYFARGRELLGNNAGGMLAKLLKLKGGNVALARADLERASTKDSAKAYIGKIIYELSPSGTNGHAYADSWNYAAAEQRKNGPPEVSAEERDRVGRKMKAFAVQLRGKAGETGKTPLAELERLAELAAMRDEVLGK